MKFLSCRFIVKSCVLIFIVFITASANAQTDSVDEKHKSDHVFIGTASYYAHKFTGRRTAGGELFNQKKMTAACNVLPLGTWVKVTNLKNNKSVIVMINDRLHHKNKRLIDLTIAAAKSLDFLQSGLAKVKIERVVRKSKS